MKTTITMFNSNVYKHSVIHFYGNGRDFLVKAVTGFTITIVPFRWYHKAYFYVIGSIKSWWRERDIYGEAVE